MWFSSRVAALEAGGVRLTAFEFGNEINTAGYDGDFPIPASGRGLGYPISITPMTRKPLP